MQCVIKIFLQNPVAAERQITPNQYIVTRVHLDFS